MEHETPEKVCSAASVGGVAGEEEVGDDAALEQVLLDDAFQDGGGAGVIPYTARIDDGYRAANADAQTVGFGAIDQGIRAGQIQFLEAALEEFPGFKAGFFGAALWLGLVGAKEDVAGVMGQAQGLDGLAQRG